MTVIVKHTNGSESPFRNVTRVDCDGEIVAIHYYNKDREIESAFYELGFDPRNAECTINSYTVSVQ